MLEQKLMRIALFHNAPSGGAKRAIYEWTRRLSPVHEVDVFTLSSADHTFCDIRPFARQHKTYEFTPHDLFHSPWGRLNQVQRWRDLRRLSAIEQQMAAEINSSGYDVVFANTCRFTHIPALLQYLTVPAVYYLHEAFGKGLRRAPGRSYQAQSSVRRALDSVDPAIKLYYESLAEQQRQSVHAATRLLANSQFTRAQMKHEYGVDAPVCHCGVDSSLFRPLPEVHKGRHILSVGELSPRKGFSFLVESLAQIPAAERPMLRLACNSVREQERRYVEGLAHELAVDLQIMTNLNTQELAIQYNEALLCVYAPVAEPFGLVPLEAMSCGTPVVGVREGGVSESVIDGSTGLLTDRDPQQFAAAVSRLLSNRGLRESLGATARAHVLQNWTWDRSVEGLEGNLVACARSRQAA